ncbi:hypothetical protein ACXDF8_16525 [Mycolicibacterium sp. CBM1]
MPDPARDISAASPVIDPAPTPGQRLARWAAPLAVLLGVVAVGLSIWALMSVSSKSTDSVALPGDPKTRVCSAFDTVVGAVALQTHKDLGTEPVAQAAVAGNARLALVGGGEYLLHQLDGRTPADLADAVRSFSRDLQDIGINALAGVQNADARQAARLADGDASRKQVADLCK